MLPPFELERPTSVAELVAIINDDALPYCGGTELLLAMKMGLLRPRTLVDVKSVAALSGVRLEGGRIVIGASTSHAAVAASDIVARHLPLLKRVENGVGNARVRAQGSIGGNLCFAEPRSDITTVLAALDATVTLMSSRGTRQVDVADFLLGAYWVDREPDELLTEISIPITEEQVAGHGAYLKLQTSERPTVGVVALRRPNGIRVGIGAVSEKPLIVDLEHADGIDYDSMVDSLEPVADLAGSVLYKKHVATVYVERALGALRELVS